MPSTAKKNEELTFNDSVKQNGRGEAILGRLEGPCADIISSTRNGRYYPESLWEKVFNNELVKEQFECGGILGELDHPTDRTETCTEKVAICMSEPPTKDDNGHLVAKFDILDTPNGRIAYTLAKYGYKLGVSSRGDGEVFENYDGTSTVDEDTYNFAGFDLVLMPAVKAARLNLVNESLNGKTFSQAINESLASANPNDRSIMQETLDNLKIKYSKKLESKGASTSKLRTANSVGVADEMKDLQEALKQNKLLSQQVKSLQEQLSVYSVKDARAVEQMGRYKQSIISLSEEAKKAKALNVQVASLTKRLQESEARNERLTSRVRSLTEGRRSDDSNKTALNEAIGRKDREIARLKEQVMRAQSDVQAQNDSLRESLSSARKDAALQNKEYTEKLAQSKKVVEHYKSVARTAVDKYIEQKALAIGAHPNEIKSRLSEHYSFSEIDQICEDLQALHVRVSRLPFDAKKGASVPNVGGNGVKMRVTESIEPIKPKSKFDDTVDADLIRLVQSQINQN